MVHGQARLDAHGTGGPLRVLLAVLALGGCGSDAASPKRDPAPAPTASGALTQAPPSASPPSFAYSAPQPFRPNLADAPEVAPPDPAKEAWRALVSQSAPLQKKTPRWQALDAERSVELTMAEGSAFRCIVSPLSVTPEAEEFAKAPDAWVLARTLVCSSDGFRSWTEQAHVTRLLPDGTREITMQGGALLRERDAAGAVRESYVLLRSEPEKREATTGPARIVPGSVGVD